MCTLHACERTTHSRASVAPSLRPACRCRMTCLHSLLFLRLFQMYDVAQGSTAAGASPSPLQMMAPPTQQAPSQHQQEQLLQHQLNAVATLAAQQQQAGYPTSTAALSDLLAQASASPTLSSHSMTGATGVSGAAAGLDSASALYGSASAAAALNASHLMASALFVLRLPPPHSQLPVMAEHVTSTTCSSTCPSAPMQRSKRDVVFSSIHVTCVLYVSN